ncbi:MAG TPA: SDR family oxidoreductase [Bdellovibrionota bacterium]|nr:SDR family oxidoreductase [Bdellovibrionota bacterium]
MSRYLVTGGAGFIGSHIVETLARKGHDVIVLDDLSTGKKENVSFGSDLADRVRLIEGSVSDPRAAAHAAQGVDVVFHEAALGSVPKSVADPMRSHEANITGTLTMLIAARDAKVKRFVNAASSSAYGDTPELPKRETMPPNPFSPYAATKLAQEQYCRAFSVSYGMETISLRYFNVYGARQDPRSEYAAVIPRFFQAYLKGDSPAIYGDGEQTRDFTYVADVVRANLLAAEIQGAKGEIVNIAGGKAISINELASMIGALVGGKQKPKHEAARPGDIKHSLADVRFSKELLGWQPTTSLDAGLRLAYPWYRAHIK